VNIGIHGKAAEAHDVLPAARFALCNPLIADGRSVLMRLHVINGSKPCLPPNNKYSTQSHVSQVTKQDGGPGRGRSRLEARLWQAATRKKAVHQIDVPGCQQEQAPQQPPVPSTRGRTQTRGSNYSWLRQKKNSRQV
jgi:hypothetical protein